MQGTPRIDSIHLSVRACLSHQPAPLISFSFRHCLAAAVVEALAAIGHLTLETLLEPWRSVHQLLNPSSSPSSSPSHFVGSWLHLSVSSPVCALRSFFLSRGSDFNACFDWVKSFLAVENNSFELPFRQATDSAMGRCDAMADGQSKLPWFRSQEVTLWWCLITVHCDSCGGLKEASPIGKV